MTSAVHAQMVMQVLGSLAHIARSQAQADAAKRQLVQQHALAELQAQTLAHVVDAVVTRRYDLLQQGFVQILQEYADQAQHYRAQQDRYMEMELSTQDPLRRIETRKRINDIDAELRQIRLDARKLYERMISALVSIGAPRFQMPPALGTALTLSSPQS